MRQYIISEQFFQDQRQGGFLVFILGFFCFVSLVNKSKIYCSRGKKKKNQVKLTWLVWLERNLFHWLLIFINYRNVPLGQIRKATDKQHHRVCCSSDFWGTWSCSSSAHCDGPQLQESGYWPQPGLCYGVPDSGVFNNSWWPSTVVDSVSK